LWGVLFTFSLPDKFRARNMQPKLGVGFQAGQWLVSLFYPSLAAGRGHKEVSSPATLSRPMTDRLIV